MSDELRNGWLSPTGEFFECGYCDHIDVAQKLTEPLQLPDYDFKTERRISADDKLLNAGWVYIGFASVIFREWMIGWRHHLTHEQRMFLAPYFEKEDGFPVNAVAMMRWKEETE